MKREDRSHRKEKGDYHEREKERDRDRGRDRERDRDRHKQQEEEYGEPKEEQWGSNLVFPTETGSLSNLSPTKSLLLRGLKTITTEDAVLHDFLSLLISLKISEYLKIYGAVEEVRLVRDKVSLESRGFAFVDFYTVEDAKNVMDYTRGTITIDGQSVHLDYSRSQGAPAKPQSYHPDFKDWVCPKVKLKVGELTLKCNGSNFARRRACYLCQTPKPAHPLLTAVDQHRDSLIPCTVLVVRGLDITTTEDSVLYTKHELTFKIRELLSQYAPLKEVRLIRDKLTHISRGFCFVELNSLEVFLLFETVLRATRKQST
jgi:RNA-binding protein 5/10